MDTGVHVGRNAPCPCGSGKKYKKCCLSAVQARMMPPRPAQRNGEQLVFHQTPAQMAAAKERSAIPPPRTAASPMPPGKAEPGKEQLIRGTAEHPFYVYGKGWTPLGELKPGDWLRTDDGWVSVDKVEDTGKYETVYNLRVADYHTYFVGAQDWGFGVWAHNAQYATQQELAQDLVRISPSRVRFRGMEVRATRKLDHLTEAQLRYGYEHGVSPRHPGGGGKIILHHHRQQVEGPLIEMPQRAHRQSNPNQHPLGNLGGVGNAEAKGSFNNWRKDYWQARYAEELFRRGLKP